MFSHSRSVSFARRRWRCIADSAVAREIDPGSTRVWQAPHLLRWMATTDSFGGAKRSAGGSGEACSLRSARETLVADAVESVTDAREAQPATQTRSADVVAAAKKRTEKRRAIEYGARD